MFMIMFVLDDPEKLPDILDGWEKAGVTGVTIIESTGMHRVKRKFLPIGYLPAYYGHSENHQTLIAVVEKEDLIKTCLEAAEAVVGDLMQPNTGIFAAWPLHTVKGMGKQYI